jgi:hypothetical protein
MIFPTLDLKKKKKKTRGEGGSTKLPSLIALTELLKMQKISQFPYETVRIKV